MPALRLEGIGKTFPGGQAVVAGMDLDLSEDELVVLLGPSGCGKSTLLRIVAGIETPTKGRVFIAGKDVTDLPAQRRDVAMVFQSYALYPHMSVRENLAFGLRMRGTDRGIVNARVREVAEKLGLTTLLERRPAQLSGGQRQRVALGRAIVRRPSVFLLDEPLSNLDAQLRITTRTEIARLQRELRAPMLYVTHDQEEAMTLGDRIVIMRAGLVLQIGTPREIYLNPACRFVAGFVGSPAMNFASGDLVVGAKEVRIPGFRRPLHVKADGAPADGVRAGGASPRTSQSSEPAAPAVSGEATRPVVVGFRPEDLRIVEPDQADLIVRPERLEPLGRELLLHAVPEQSTDGPAVALRALVDADHALQPAGRLGLQIRPDRIHLFDPETDQRIAL
jgi:ABC-type sugar transport system ATPase subunit